MSLSAFSEALALLEALYSPEQVTAEMARMEAVFAESEQLWADYLAQVPERKVRYLMIAEAPPCTDSEVLQYIFNPAARPRTLITALVKAFFGDPIYKEIGMAATLAELADRGFLLVDAIPFAMPFSKGGKRGKTGYGELIQATARSYMLNKLNASGIQWDPDLRIAFSLRKTAEAVIAAFPEGIPFEALGKSVPISDEMVAVNAANYPDAEKIKALYGLG